MKVGFSHLGQRMTMARTIKLYKARDECSVGFLRNQGVGFRVRGSGLRVWGIGFKVWGVWFRVWV